MHALWTVLVAALCVAAAVGDEEVAQAPSCPDVEVVKDFDVAAYTGRWYEIQRYPVRFQPFGACVTATYTQLEGEPGVKVVNRQINDNTSMVDSIEGTARLADDSGDARLLVKFPTTPGEGFYWVLDTDYTSYSIVYSCREFNGQLSESSWVLSRRPTLSKSCRKKVNCVLEENGVDKSKYVVTRQDDTCIYE